MTVSLILILFLNGSRPINMLIWLHFSASLVCQLPCSGHGSCDPKTRKCQCSTYWMENPFKSQLGRKESNCGMFAASLQKLHVNKYLLMKFHPCVGHCIYVACSCFMHSQSHIGLAFIDVDTGMYPVLALPYTLFTT